MSSAAASGLCVHCLYFGDADGELRRADDRRKRTSAGTAITTDNKAGAHDDAALMG